MSLKRDEKCPVCEGHVIGLFPSVSLSAETVDGKWIKSSAFPLALYTCGDCGYCELYAVPPVPGWKRTPAERDVAFSWVHPPPANDEGPYR